MWRAVTFCRRFVSCPFLTRDSGCCLFISSCAGVDFFLGIDTRQELDAAMDEETRRKRQLKRKIIKQKQKVCFAFRLPVHIIWRIPYFVHYHISSFSLGYMLVKDRLDSLTSQLRKRLLLNAGGGVDGDGEPDMFELRDIKSSAALQTVEESMMQ